MRAQRRSLDRSPSSGFVRRRARRIRRWVWGFRKAGDNADISPLHPVRSKVRRRHVQVEFACARTIRVDIDTNPGGVSLHEPRGESTKQIPGDARAAMGRRDVEILKLALTPEALRKMTSDISHDGTIDARHKTRPREQGPMWMVQAVEVCRHALVCRASKSILRTASRHCGDVCRPGLTINGRRNLSHERQEVALTPWDVAAAAALSHHIVRTELIRIVVPFQK